MAKKKAVRKTATKAVAADKLAPVIHALTTTGPGRWVTICDAYHAGLFEDPRLRPYAIAALNDPSSDIAKTIAEYVIPIYGKDAYADIEATIDIKGKWSETKKLELLYEMDPARTRPLIEQVFATGSIEMRTTVLFGELYRLPADLPILMQFAKAKAAIVRYAALGKLVHIESDEVLELWKAALVPSELGLLTRYIGECKNKRLIKYVLEEIVRELDEICKCKDIKLLESKTTRVYNLFTAFWRRKQKLPSSFVQQLADRLARVKKVKVGYTSSVTREMSDVIAKYTK